MVSFLCQAMPIVVIIIVTLQEARGMSLSGRSGSSGETLGQHHSRVKRCSCNDWEDKECIYFCHLDIIWVNTPSKLLPYGLGNPSPRRRRSAQRCQCVGPNDAACNAFCRSSENTQMDAVEKSPKVTRRSGGELLQSLRSVVQSNSKRLLSKGHHTELRHLKTSTKR